MEYSLPERQYAAVVGTQNIKDAMSKERRCFLLSRIALEVTMIIATRVGVAVVGTIIFIAWASRG